MKLAVLSAIALLAAAGAAHASGDDDFCRNGSFPTSEPHIALSKVTGQGRLNFLQDMNGCPNETPACRQRAYVMPGDQLLTGRTRGAYVCAFFPNAVGGSAGWVAKARLAPVTFDANPPPLAWTGRWKDGDDEIRLKPHGASLSVSGEAYWPSANPSPREAPGGPNLGDLSGDAHPAGNRLILKDKDADDCAATLTLVGAWLIAADNNNCGGQNVTFSGVYRRK